MGYAFIDLSLWVSPFHNISRILGVLVTCLDSFLYLESQYSILEALLALQRESIPEDRYV